MDGTTSVGVIVGVEGLIVDVAIAGTITVTVPSEASRGMDVATGAVGEQADNIRWKARPLIHTRLNFSRLTFLSRQVHRVKEGGSRTFREISN